MAAGLGFKTFTTGEVLTAADTNGYLMQGILVFANAAARDAAITSPQEGQACYLKDTNGVLTYSGSAWVAVGGATGDNYVLLNSGGTALTGAQTVTVSGISGANSILVLVASGSSATAGSIISLRLNTDTGSNYYAFGYYLNEGTPIVINAMNGTAASNHIIGKMDDGGAGSAVSGAVKIDGCNTSGVKILASTGFGTLVSGSANNRAYNTRGYYNSSSVITSISIFSSTGNLDAGTVFVYTSA